MIAEPETLHVMEVDSSNWDIVRQGMSRVTMPGGTGARLADFPIRVAGKTGTAQVAGGGGMLPSHTLFVAYAPLEEPEIALAVFIKHGESKVNTAIPVARKNFGRVFSYSRIAGKNVRSPASKKF